MIALRDWQIGDSVRNNEHHQQAVLALRELQRKQNAGNKRPPFRTQFIGEIVDKGKDFEGFDIADFTDCRYWVEMQFIPGAGVDDAIVLDTDTSMKVPGDAAAAPTPDPRNIVAATNLAEYEDDTHLLRVDGTVKVDVVAFYDTGSAANNLHFVFSRSLQNPFVCLCTVDGGAAGSDVATCDFTYTITDLAANAITGGTTLTPARPRLVNVEYETPADGSPGLAYYDAAGVLKLYEVVEEIPKSDACPPPA